MMDGIHDLGGRQGFGAIDVGEAEAPFHSDWEARLYGIVRAMQRGPNWTLDRFRYFRECIGPVDYLTRPYFDQWLQTYAALMIDSGLATAEEVAAGRSASGQAGLPAPMTAAGVAVAKKKMVDYERADGPAPRFAVGDTVRARLTGAVGHTRLPAYVRGHVGRVTHHHGSHVLPDANAHGTERAEPLYTVGFEAATLWPERARSRDRIHLELWDSYLEHP
jgi:nitrile hydratase beta subunit